MYKRSLCRILKKSYVFLGTPRVEDLDKTSMGAAALGTVKGVKKPVKAVNKRRGRQSKRIVVKTSIEPAVPISIERTTRRLV